MSTQQVSDTSEETQLGVDLPENQKTWGDWRTYHDFFTDKFVWEIIYQKKQKGFYVEAGACDGVIQSQTKMLDEKGWDGLLVEPAWPFHDLVPKNRPNALFDKRALVGSEQEGKMIKFAQSEHHTLSHVIQGEESASYEVEGATLRTILDDNECPFDIDFIGLDIEGGYEGKSLEEKVLYDFFEGRHNYRVGVFAVEFYWPPIIDSLFEKMDYVKMDNPFLKGVHLGPNGISYVLTREGWWQSLQGGDIKDWDFKDMKPIVWESIYVHKRLFQENPLLFNFIAK